tara:strand:- start:1577 stop:2197 length:621 start_codon:yes stop_codon:yes gene_type:complete
MPSESRPGAHCFVHSFARADDPTKAVDEPVPSNHRRGGNKWCTGKQNRGFSGSSINAGDAMLSDDGTRLHAVFKEALAKKHLAIRSWQTRVDVPPSAPSIFQGFAPIMDCLCTDRSLTPVPVEVKASRPRKLKRRSAKDTGMKAPFDAFADTYGMRHQIQLCLQNAALGNVKPKGFVAYVDVVNEEVTLVQMNKAVWALAREGPAD